MNTLEYMENRAKFPTSELMKYQGSWVAFSGDGRRIVASGADMDRLEEERAARRQDPEKVMLECIPGATDDAVIGGEDTSLNY